MTNLLPYGGFDRGLVDWIGGALDYTIGYYRAPSLHLVSGETAQSPLLSISANQPYTIYLFFRVANGGKVNVSWGGKTVEVKGPPNDVWMEGGIQFAYDADVQSRLQFECTNQAAWIDAVAVLVGGLASTRVILTNMLIARLRSLATQVGLTSAPSAIGPNGDYTPAIDHGLRTVGAVDEYGDPTVINLIPANINNCVDSAYNAMLVALRSDYALITDTRLGPREEKGSQIAAAINAMLGAGGAGGAGAAAGGRVSTGKLTYGDWPR